MINIICYNDMQDLGNLKITIEKKTTERIMVQFIAQNLASKMKLEDIFLRTYLA